MKLKTHIPLCSKVRHKVPSMLFNQTGIAVAYDGVRYGRQYIMVHYTNPKTKTVYNTSFWDNVLETVK